MAETLASLPDLTAMHELAALRMVQKVPFNEIALEVGVSRQTLSNWKRKPQFKALMDQKKAMLITSWDHIAIANKARRLEVLNDAWMRTINVINERAKRHGDDFVDRESPQGATRRFFGSDTPAEATTGMMVRQESINAQGQMTVNWAYDTGLVNSLMKMHDLAGKETGQHTEKREDTTRVEVTVMIERIAQEAGLDPAEITAEAVRYLEAANR